MFSLLEIQKLIASTIAKLDDIKADVKAIREILEKQK